MLRALLCFSVFLRFQLPAGFLITSLRQSTFNTPEMGASRWRLGQPFAADPWIKQPHAFRSGPCRTLVPKVCLFIGF